MVAIIHVLVITIFNLDRPICRCPLTRTQTMQQRIRHDVIEGHGHGQYPRGHKQPLQAVAQPCMNTLVHLFVKAIKCQPHVILRRSMP